MTYNKKQRQTTMPNYQEGKIYNTCNTVSNDIYIGRTTLKLCARIRDHRTRHRTQAYNHLLLYKAIACRLWN